MPTKKKSSHRSVKKYNVHAELSNFRLARAKSALRLQIYDKGTKVGELEVGRGSLYWHGAHRHRSKRIDWGQFAAKMDELAYGPK
jgi:hypothetical protein